METFSVLLALCEGNPLVTGGFPSQRPVTRSFEVFFDLPLNKRLGKQSRRQWFEMLSSSLWRHCNARKLSLYNGYWCPGSLCRHAKRSCDIEWVQYEVSFNEEGSQVFFSNAAWSIARTNSTPSSPQKHIYGSGHEGAACLFTWFCYQMIAKPGNKTAAPSWPDLYIIYCCLQNGTHFVWASVC